ncbi:ferroxidase fet3 [Phytophthora pseudosyringae]|uniref:Ferroxidase fet3 n=1 Tax=Phytophthora pseudosyringae TaxID=221518 RepID=A0A8T1VP86_9STRA|nr:ferroxidase fet3 [Phytophthora pseudosyringae]
MDGTSGITQCHIDPNGTTVYRFTHDKAGTFWWHSHHSTQYAYGLRGPLVVHAPANDRQSWEEDIAEEFIVQLADQYHDAPVGAPIWDSMIVNNRGRYNCTAAASHSFTDCTDDQPLTKFLFQTGNKYLLRLINVAALSPVMFSIDDPRVPGRSCRHASEGVWFHGFNYEGLAIVQYEEDDDTEPTSEQIATVTTVTEFEFTPLVSTELPSTPSDRVILAFDLHFGLGYFSMTVATTATSSCRTSHRFLLSPEV